jgi:hypothetical protein
MPLGQGWDGGGVVEVTFTAHKPKAPTFCELGKHVDLFCSTGAHREQITANIAGNALVVFD